MQARIGFSNVVRLACLATAFILSTSSWTPAGVVRGTIIDRDGKPAAGAKVWVAKLEFRGPSESREGTADAQGAFAVEVSPGDWVVFAVRGNEGGRAAWEFLSKVEEGKDPAPVTVRLQAPTTFKGRLLDAETGRPIAGGKFALDDARRLEVDAEGWFEAPGLESTHHEAYPICPSYERKRILFDTTGRPDAELELKLPRAGKIVGRVLDANGKPVAGATVGLVTSGTIFSGAALWEKCSDDGRYTYDGKPIGRTGRLTARAPGYSDQERSDVVALDASNPTEVNFTLRPDPRQAEGSKKTAGANKVKATNVRSVSGTVVGPEGKPVTSAVVRWDLLVSSDPVPETKTNDKGEFRLEAVPDSTNVLSVMAPGLAPGFPMVEAGGDRVVKVELPAGATIRGRVVDDAGSPIEGVSVVPKVGNPKPNWGGTVYLHELQCKTDREGRFVLEGMPAGVSCDIVAEGLSAVRQRVLSATDESQNVVTLLGGGAIRGRVVDPSGRPVRNFRIQVGIPPGLKPGEPAGGYFAGYTGTGLAFTRNDGDFTISGLTAGNLHHLTVIAENYGAGVADRVVAQSITRLNPAEALTIKLGDPRSLRVRVYQAEGKIVEGARVTLIQNAGAGGFQWGYSESSWDDSVTVRVNREGWADFPSLSFAKGTVVVRAKGFSRSRLGWVHDEEEFNVFLEPESKVEGNVLDDAGKPVAGARITLSWGMGEMMNIPIDDKDGRFQADGLAAGNYLLSIQPAVGPAVFSDSIDLEAGKTLTKEIRIKPPAPGAAKLR